MSDLAAVERARDETLKAFGKIDILVNNAGIAGVNKTVWETDLEEWRKVLRINLDGPFICCKAIVPCDGQTELRPDRQHRLDRRQGRQSQRGALFGFQGRPDRADEIAGQGLAHAASWSCGDPQHPASHLRQMTQTHIDFMLSKIPKNRFVLVEELAAMVAWLASEDCSFSTGAVFRHLRRPGDILRATPRGGFDVSASRTDAIDVNPR